MTTWCATCPGELYPVDLLTGHTTCVECARRALAAATRAKHAGQQQALDARPADEWSVFVAAVKSSVRADGTVHQGDVRPKIRGRIQPKHIGTLYRRARAEGLLVDTGEREPSSDTAGRNADKLSRIYRLTGQPLARAG